MFYLSHTQSFLGGTMMRSIIINGTYRHFKGNEYKVLYLAKHSETQEDMVVYQALYGNHAIWVRPVDMFLEYVVRDGKTYERFSYVPPKVESCLHVELDDATKDYLIENSIDLIYELEREHPQIICRNDFSEDGTKDLGITILCGGLAASAIVLSISKLLDTVFHRPRIIIVEDLDENGNVTQRSELLQPNIPKTTFSVSTEIDSTKAKITIEDRKE